MLMGCVMSTVPSLIVVTPILVPIAIGYGIDPLHFGIIVVVNLCMAQVIPSVGSCLFIVSSMFDISIERVVKANVIYSAVLFLVVLMVTYVPFISLFLPTIFGFR